MERAERRGVVAILATWRWSAAGITVADGQFAETIGKSSICTTFNDVT